MESFEKDAETGNLYVDLGLEDERVGRSGIYILDDEIHTLKPIRRRDGRRLSIDYLVDYWLMWLALKD